MRYRLIIKFYKIPATKYGIQDKHIDESFKTLKEASKHDHLVDDSVCSAIIIDTVTNKTVKTIK